MPAAPIRSVADLERTGISPRDFPLLGFEQPAPATMPLRKKYRGLKDLYVTDVSFPYTKVVIYKNRSYDKLGTITNGVYDPFADTLDAKGNLYVADAVSAPSDPVEITEYAPGADSPFFTYNAGVTDPINVSVDAHGNVYEADWQAGLVNEYAQGKNRVINSCSPGGGVEGIAIDQHDDVFVSYNTSGNPAGRIEEYPGGLKGCKGTTLPVTFVFVGGIVLDAHGTLIVCDQENHTVDLIAPPYSSMTGTLGTGFGTPDHVSVNKANTLVFVNDVLYLDVRGLAYPSGKNVVTLGSSDGLQNPFGVVDGPNAVY